MTEGVQRTRFATRSNPPISHSRNPNLGRRSQSESTPRPLRLNPTNTKLKISHTKSEEAECKKQKSKKRKEKDERKVWLSDPRSGKGWRKLSPKTKSSGDLLVWMKRKGRGKRKRKRVPAIGDRWWSLNVYRSRLGCKVIWLHFCGSLGLRLPFYIEMAMIEASIGGMAAFFCSLSGCSILHANWKDQGRLRRKGKDEGGMAPSSSAIMVVALPTPLISDDGTNKEGKEVDTKRKKQIDVSLLLNMISKIKENQMKTMGFVLVNPITLDNLISILPIDWNLIHGEFEVTPKQSRFEIKFSNPTEQKRIWEGRPYHVFDQLLILRPSWD